MTENLPKSVIDKLSMRQPNTIKLSATVSILKRQSEIRSHVNMRTLIMLIMT